MGNRNSKKYNVSKRTQVPYQYISIDENTGKGKNYTVFVKTYDTSNFQCKDFLFSYLEMLILQGIDR